MHFHVRHISQSLHAKYPHAGVHVSLALFQTNTLDEPHLSSVAIIFEQP